jgi:poly-gamma-glutamate biosynthesis protein PgsC/CapC
VNELLALSVGVGLVVSLLFTELFGMATGGMVVPGYFALHLTRPLDCLLTFGAGFAAFAVVHALSSFVIVYGRRRTVLMILVGYGFGMLARTLVPQAAGSEAEVIGLIIPGLIAIWLDRQGIVETACALVTTSVMTRLILVLVVGTELAR